MLSTNNYRIKAHLTPHSPWPHDSSVTVVSASLNIVITGYQVYTKAITTCVHSSQVSDSSLCCGVVVTAVAV